MESASKEVASKGWDNEKLLRLYQLIYHVVEPVPTKEQQAAIVAGMKDSGYETHWDSIRQKLWKGKRKDNKSSDVPADGTGADAAPTTPKPKGRRAAAASKTPGSTASKRKKAAAAAAGPDDGAADGDEQPAADEAAETPARKKSRKGTTAKGRAKSQAQPTQQPEQDKQQNAGQEEGVDGDDAAQELDNDEGTA